MKRARKKDKDACLKTIVLVTTILNLINAIIKLLE